MESREVAFEFIWILIILAVIAGFSASMAYYGFARGLNPACTVYTEEELEAKGIKLEPGVKEVGPGIYEVTIEARQFVWIPREIVLKDPVRVTFRVYTPDVVHGLHIVGTSVNVMVIPGYVAEFVWEPPRGMKGETIFICHEYCGIGHQLMWGKIVIERSGVMLDGGLSGGVLGGGGVR
jgi:cytochrome c oxidase subunit 2